MSVVEKNYDSLLKHITKYSIEYNLGNAKDSLFKIQRSAQNFEFLPESVTLLTEAKNHFWQAFKSANLTERDNFPQLFVNLANTLDTSGRISSL